MKILEDYLNGLDIKIVELKNKEDIDKFKKQFEVPKLKNDYTYQVLIDKDNNYLGGIVYGKYENPIEGFKPDVWIYFLFILPEYRHKGFGKKLLNIPLSKYEHISLGTDKESSEHAIMMYRKIGFKIIKVDGKYKYWFK